MSTNETDPNRDGQAGVANAKDDKKNDGNTDTVRVTLAGDPDVDNIPSIRLDPAKKLSITKLNAGYGGLAFDLMRADGQPLTGIKQIFVFVGELKFL